MRERFWAIGLGVLCRGFFLTLSFSPASRSVSPPVSASLCLSPAVCLGVRFVSAQEMSPGSRSPTCSWLFARIQSLSLSWLGPTARSHSLPPGLQRRSVACCQGGQSACEARMGDRVAGHWLCGAEPLRAVSVGRDGRAGPRGQISSGTMRRVEAPTSEKPPPFCPAP